MDSINIDWSLISMSDIRPDVRKIAVSWAESNNYNWIGDKHKLASDIQNYTDWYCKEVMKEKEALILELKKEVVSLQNVLINPNL